MDLSKIDPGLLQRHSRTGCSFAVDLAKNSKNERLDHFEQVRVWAARQTRLARAEGRFVPESAGAARACLGSMTENGLRKKVCLAAATSYLSGDFMEGRWSAARTFGVDREGAFLIEALLAQAA